MIHTLKNYKIINMTSTIYVIQNYHMSFYIVLVEEMKLFAFWRELKRNSF